MVAVIIVSFVEVSYKLIMYCTYCGSKNTKSSKFCKNCGKNIGSPEDVASPTPQETLSNYMSPSKVAVLSILSFGIYEIVWFYRQWKYVKVVKKLNIAVWARAIFTPIFAYSLFKEIVGMTKEAGDSTNKNPGWLFVLYLIPTVALWRFLIRIGYHLC